MFSRPWPRPAFAGLAQLFTSLFGRMPPRVMDCRMKFRRNNLKVFRPIIEFIAVDMVCILARLERSPYLLFEYIAAYIDLLSVYSHLAITGVHLVVRLSRSFLSHVDSLKVTALPFWLHLSRVRHNLRRAVSNQHNVAFTLDRMDYITH